MSLVGEKCQNVTPMETKCPTELVHISSKYFSPWLEPLLVGPMHKFMHPRTEARKCPLHSQTRGLKWQMCLLTHLKKKCSTLMFTYVYIIMTLIEVVYEALQHVWLVKFTVGNLARVGDTNTYAWGNTCLSWTINILFVGSFTSSINRRVSWGNCVIMGKACNYIKLILSSPPPKCTNCVKSRRHTQVLAV